MRRRRLTLVPPPVSAATGSLKASRTPAMMSLMAATARFCRTNPGVAGRGGVGRVGERLSWRRLSGDRGTQTVTIFIFPAAAARTRSISVDLWKYHCHRRAKLHVSDEELRRSSAEI